MKLVSVVIPAFNEEPTIKRVIEEVKKIDLSPLGLTMEIVVVDDGSKDRTPEILSAIPGIKYIRKEKNEGKGSAIRTGLKNISGDIVLVQDADLEYDPRDYPALLWPFIEGKAEVVFGSRFLKQKRSAGMSRAHYYGNKFLTGLTNLLYRGGITDEATCYKVFRSELLKDIGELECKEFEFCPEITAKFLRRWIRIHEVPISYLGRTVEEGKKIAWKDGFQAVSTLLKFRFKRMKGN